MDWSRLGSGWVGQARPTQLGTAGLMAVAKGSAKLGVLEICSASWAQQG